MPGAVTRRSAQLLCRGAVSHAETVRRLRQLIQPTTNDNAATTSSQNGV